MHAIRKGGILRKKPKKRRHYAASVYLFTYLYRSALMVMLLPRSCHWRVMW